MGKKADYLTALRTLPAGLTEFLAVPIPAPPEGLSIPTTEEEATIMQGVLSFYLLEFFAAFAGLTPVPLALRIGQHSNVAESLLLSGLEYITESDENQEFAIIEPVEGQQYTPGDVRLTVKIKGLASTVQSTTDNPVTPEIQTTDLTSDDGIIFYGFARLPDNGEYTSIVTVTFGDDAKTQKTQSIHFIIADVSADTKNPEGSDLPAFDAGLGQLDSAYNDAMKAAEDGIVDPGMIDNVKAAAAIVYYGAKSIAGETLTALADDLMAAVDAL